MSSQPSVQGLQHKLRAWSIWNNIVIATERATHELENIADVWMIITLLPNSYMLIDIQVYTRAATDVPTIRSVKNKKNELT